MIVAGVASSVVLGVLLVTAGEKVVGGVAVVGKVVGGVVETVVVVVVVLSVVVVVKVVGKSVEKVGGKVGGKAVGGVVDVASMGIGDIARGLTGGLCYIK